MGTAANMRIYENLALANKKGCKVGLKWSISKDDLNSYKEMIEVAKFRAGKQLKL